MTKQDTTTGDHPAAITSTDSRLSLILLIIRMIFYVLALAGTVQLLLTGAASEDYAELFREGHIVEWVQQLLIMGCAILLGIAGWLGKESRPSLWILCALATLAAIRELDAFFDQLIPLAGWQLPAGIALLTAIVLMIRHRATLIRQFDRYARTLSAGIIWCGFVEVVIFAQIIGQAEKWRPLLGENYTRHLKRVIEESSETFGYLLLFFGAIEAIIWALRLRKKSKAVGMIN